MAGMQNALWVIVLLINVITFALFGIDKMKSKRQGASRIAERTLLGFMLFGGLVGGWLAMKLFRHKTVKRSFRVQAVLCTLFSPVWILVWWWWTTLGDGS